MAEFASNTPISRPVVMPIRENASFNGMSWNNEIGLFFPVEQELLPLRPPSDFAQGRVE